MKTLKRKKMHLLFPVMLIAICSTLICGCEQNSSYDTVADQNQILESVEFQEYFKAHLLFTNSLKEAKCNLEPISTYNSFKVYKLDFKSARLYQKTVAARKVFIEKYPTFSLLDAESKIKMCNRSVQLSEELSLLSLRFNQRGIRLKSMASEALSQTPTPSGYSFLDFPSADAAYAQARTSTVEVAGYVFSDGSAIYMSSTSATDSTFQIYWVSTFGCATPWHFHPSGNTAVSDADDAARDSINKWSGCVKGFIIVTSNDAYNPWH